MCKIEKSNYVNPKIEKKTGFDQPCINECYRVGGDCPPELREQGRRHHRPRGADCQGNLVFIHNYHDLTFDTEKYRLYHH